MGWTVILHAIQFTLADYELVASRGDLFYYIFPTYRSYLQDVDLAMLHWYDINQRHVNYRDATPCKRQWPDEIGRCCWLSGYLEPLQLETKCLYAHGVFFLLASALINLSAAQVRPWQHSVKSVMYFWLRKRILRFQIETISSLLII